VTAARPRDYARHRLDRIRDNTYARWFDEKYGGEKRCQRWVKAHAQVGTVTNVITAVEVTESTVGDAPMLAPLLKSTAQAGFDVREVSADKAHLSNELLTAIEAAGAAPYVPFKGKSRGTGASDARRRSRRATTSSSPTTTSGAT
jgi:hypothetical protein